jgi:hypothetical protein
MEPKGALLIVISVSSRRRARVNSPVGDHMMAYIYRIVEVEPGSICCLSVPCEDCAGKGDLEHDVLLEVTIHLRVLCRVLRVRSCLDESYVDASSRSRCEPGSSRCIHKGMSKSCHRSIRLIHVSRLCLRDLDHCSKRPKAY